MISFIQYIARKRPWYNLRDLRIRIAWFSLYGIRIPSFSLYGIRIPLFSLYVDVAQTFELQGHCSE